MALIRPQKFIIEAFKEQASWIGSLLQPLNFMFDDLRIAFSNNITIADNLNQEIKEIKFKNSSNNFPLTFKTKFNSNPKGLMMIYLYDETLSKGAAINPAIEWKYKDGDIQILSLSGLTASTIYTIRFLVIYG